MSFIVKRQTKMVTAAYPEEWHPAFSNNKVKVVLGLYNFNGYYMKLAVWSADDQGYEIEKRANSLEKAEELFSKLMSDYDSIPDPIDIDWLKENGFERV